MNLNLSEAAIAAVCKKMSILTGMSEWTQEDEQNTASWRADVVEWKPRVLLAIQHLEQAYESLQFLPEGNEEGKEYFGIEMVLEEIATARENIVAILGEDSDTWPLREWQL